MSVKKYEELKELKKQENSDVAVQTEEEQTWLIFKAGEDNYAIQSGEVKEIIRNNQVFPIPFVPPYIKGLINCYGQPHAIVDFTLLKGRDGQNTQLYMVLNNENCISLQITNVVEFQTNPKSALKTDTENTKDSIIAGTIPFEDKEVPVINIKKITDRIRAEIE